MLVIQNAVFNNVLATNAHQDKFQIIQIINNILLLKIFVVLLLLKTKLVVSGVVLEIKY